MAIGPDRAALGEAGRVTDEQMRVVDRVVADLDDRLLKRNLSSRPFHVALTIHTVLPPELTRGMAAVVEERYRAAGWGYAAVTDHGATYSIRLGEQGSPR